jgi:hypothetical protein
MGAQRVTREAESKESVMQAFAYTHYLPTEKLLVAVEPAAAFTLHADVPTGAALKVKPESETAIRIQVRRQDGDQRPGHHPPCAPGEQCHYKQGNPGDSRSGGNQHRPQRRERDENPSA